MPNFGHSKFLPVFLYQKDLNKFEMCIFGHSEFIPVFLGKIVRKNSEQPFLAFPNLYQCSWEKCWKKFGMAIFSHSELYQSSWEKLLQEFRMAIFGHSEFIPVFLRKNVGNNLEWQFLAFLNLYQSFWEKLLEKNLECHFWPFCIYTSLFGKKLSEKFRMAIFGHSEFISVFL